LEGLLQIGEQDSGSEGGEALMEGVSVFVTVQLPDELYQKLAALAKAKQVSVSVLAGQIITDYVTEERWRDGGVA
jgi:metal-responsive CopG/Arc/MetJ family transcriptional regulator